jgi:hypothetical protein
MLLLVCECVYNELLIYTGAFCLVPRECTKFVQDAAVTSAAAAAAAAKRCSPGQINSNHYHLHYEQINHLVFARPTPLAGILIGVC